MANSHPSIRAIAALVERMDSDMPNHNTVRQLKAELNLVRRGAEALDGLRASRSPFDTEAAHAIKVAATARRFDKQVTAVLNRTTDLYRAGREAVERSIVEKVNLRPHELASEIRTRFAAIDGKKRMDHITTMIDEGRGPELAAIVDAPAFLTGLSPEQCAAFKQAMIDKHAADEVAEIAGLDAAFEHVASVSRTAGNYVRELTDPHKLAKIEREAAAADEAAAAFSQTFDQAPQ